MRMAARSTVAAGMSSLSGSSRPLATPKRKIMSAPVGTVLRVGSDQQAEARGKQQKIHGQREGPVGQTPEDRETEPGAQ